MRAWIYQRAEQVREMGSEASWYVGWIDSHGKRRARSCGAGPAGQKAATTLKLEVEKTGLFELLSDPSSRKKHRLPCLSHEKIVAYNGIDVVYFIEALGLERVKIGTTNRLSHRFHLLQSCSPVKLRILAAVKGDSQLECVLHFRFAPVRLHGEWFQLTNDLLALIARVKETDSLVIS